ncbi:MAG: HDIG domain-containing protein [Dehalococcoidia bacterium]|nr:HDIG domain-containing protein [Dehalococcoidia bacterium]
MNSRPNVGVAWLLPLVGAVLGVALTVILTFQFLPSRYDLKDGEVAHETIKSPSQVSFVSQILTQQQRDQAQAQVPETLRQDPTVATAQMSRAKEATAQIGLILYSPGLSPDEKKSMLLTVPGVTLAPENAAALSGLSPGAWPQVETEILRLVEATMRGSISALDLAQTKAALASRVSVSPTLAPALTSTVAQAAGNFIRANMVVDQEVTGQARKTAREAVSSVRVTLEKGETVIRDGEVVTPFHREKLEAAGLLNSALRWEDVVGTGLPTIILVLTLALYLYMYEGGLRAQPRRLIILALIIGVTVLAAKLTIPGRDVYAFVFPLAAAPMLIGSLISTPTAILSAVLLSVALGFLGATEPQQVVTVHLLAGLAGALLIRKADRLTTFFLAGAGVASVSFLGLLAFHLLTQGKEFSQLGLFAFVSVVNGGLSSILTLGILAFLGLVFGLVTPLQLLELAHPNQKLLRLLATEAPGTYHHSILVANLAERAAESIGADALLTRVGAYYHDIGKVARPGFFVENQLDGENIHDDLEPATSARVVCAHVEDGIKLAQKHRMPRQIQELIAQHHGNRLVAYFYHRACQGGETDPDSYRYAGPRPRSKEAAILMLADTVEASARSLNEHSTAALDGLVDRTVAENLADGQLNECDLTLRELDIIRETLKAVVKGAYHPRIEYPSSSTIVR